MFDPLSGAGQQARLSCASIPSWKEARRMDKQYQNEHQNQQNPQHNPQNQKHHEKQNRRNQNAQNERNTQKQYWFDFPSWQKAARSKAVLFFMENEKKIEKKGEKP